ncbi:hypothetical protein OAL15_01265 [Flavobacteriales bacterium]|nr:hypothetical protein [Flavobacteriales bacterium]
MQEKLLKGQAATQLNLSSLAIAYYTLTIVDEVGKYSLSHRIGKTGGQ